MNSSRLSPDQREGPAAYARDRLARARAGEGAWASTSAHARKVRDELDNYLRNEGKGKPLRGFIIKVKVKNGKAKIRKVKPWKRCP